MAGLAHMPATGPAHRMRQILIAVMIIAFALTLVPGIAAAAPQAPMLLFLVSIAAAIGQALVGWRDDAAYTARHFRGGGSLLLMALVPVLFFCGLIFRIIAERDILAAIVVTALVLGAMALCLARDPTTVAREGIDKENNASPAASTATNRTGANRTDIASCGPDADGQDICRTRARWIHRTQLLVLTVIGVGAMAQFYALNHAPHWALSIPQFALGVGGVVVLGLQGVNSLAIGRQLRNPNRRRGHIDRWNDLLPGLLFLVVLTAFITWFLGKDGVYALGIGAVLVALQLATMIALASRNRHNVVG